MSKVTDTVAALAAPLAAEQGLELWDVEYVREAGQWYLRVSIDSPEGVSIDQCETFSRALDPLLDEADPIPDSYIFEVSSAGAERELKRPGDFARFLGSTVEARLYQSVGGSKSHVGVLRGYDQGAVTLTTAAGEQRFEKSQLAQVRLRIV